MESDYMPLSTWSKIRLAVDATAQAASDPDFIPYTAESIGTMAASAFRGSGYESHPATPRLVGKLISVLLSITDGIVEREYLLDRLDDIARDYMSLANFAASEKGSEPDPFPVWLIDIPHAGGYGPSGGHWIALSAYVRAQVED